MKRALEFTGTTYRPDMAMNNVPNDQQANVAANTHQAAPAPTPPAVFNIDLATMVDRLLAQPGPGNALQPAHTAPDGVPAATLPTWSGDIPVQAGWPALTEAQRAERGDANAQYELGCIADPRSPAGLAEARTWFEKAAAQDHGDAEAQLGLLHEAEKGVPASKEHAFEWFARSANHGSAFGQMLLGEAYLNGAGVEKDSVKAYEWFSKAAAQDEWISKTFLGYMHYKGLGIEQDFQKAMHFICATDYDGEESITIDWENGGEYLKKTFPKDVNVLLPHLFSEAKLNEKAKDVAVNGPKVNDQGVLAIADTLGDNTSVNTLSLLNCEIGEVGAKALKEAVYSTVTPLREIHLDGQTGFDPEEIVAMNQRLAQNPQIIALENKYIQREIRFESRIGLPPEVAQIIVQDLIRNDQTRHIPGADGGRYATREETEVRVQELLYVVGNGDKVLPQQV